MHEVPKRVTTESWRDSESERQQNEDACSVYKDMQTILRGSFNCAANSSSFTLHHRRRSALARNRTIVGAVQRCGEVGWERTVEA